MMVRTDIPNYDFTFSPLEGVRRLLMILCSLVHSFTTPDFITAISLG